MSIEQTHKAAKAGAQNSAQAYQPDAQITAQLSLAKLMRAPQPAILQAGAGDANGEEPAPFDYSDSQSFGQYLFGGSYADPALQGKGAPNENWTSHTQSRVLVRLFSRGLMGATFYTLAHRWAPVQMKGYTATSHIDASRPLQYLARGFDVALGKPIEFYVRNYHKFAGKTAEQAAEYAKGAVTFRNSVNGGRSLGEEMVRMTSDFAAGSVGDAWGRQIANMFDPNQANGYLDTKGTFHPWHDEDGHWNYGNFAKSVAKNTWRIFSKNQGEDWAAALPYVYQMKFQRNAIDRLYPGFRISSDRGLNGGSWRINERHEPISSYAKAGALDLQARFTGYNWYTLMYRDLYENIGNRIKHFSKTGELSSPETDIEAHGLFENAAHLTRYVTKSAIKATIYMTPAVPFFWVTRTPQTKPHGIGVMVDSTTGAITPQAFSRPFDSFDRRNSRGVFDRMLTPFGKACQKTAKTINVNLARYNLASAKQTSFTYQKPTFAEHWVNASASYTPYMIAKAETALRWDRPKGADGLNGMDRAIYRFLDGGMRLNLGEVGAGLSDMRNEIIRPPSNREIQKRRVEDQELHAINQASQTPDNKVSEISEEEALKQLVAPKAQSHSRWRERAHADFAKNPYPDKGATIH